MSQNYFKKLLCCCYILSSASVYAASSSSSSPPTDEKIANLFIPQDIKNNQELFDQYFNNTPPIDKKMIHLDFSLPHGPSQELVKNNLADLSSDDWRQFLDTHPNLNVLAIHCQQQEGITSEALSNLIDGLKIPEDGTIPQDNTEESIKVRSLVVNFSLTSPQIVHLIQELPFTNIKTLVLSRQVFREENLLEHFSAILISNLERLVLDNSLIILKQKADDSIASTDMDVEQVSTKMEEMDIEESAANTATTSSSVNMSQQSSNTIQKIIDDLWVPHNDIYQVQTSLRRLEIRNLRAVTEGQGGNQPLYILSGEEEEAIRSFNELNGSDGYTIKVNGFDGSQVVTAVSSLSASS